MWIGEAEMESNQDPNPSDNDPKVGGASQLQRFPLQSKGYKPYVRFPTLGDLHWKDKPLYNIWLCKPAETCRAVGNWDSALTGFTHRLTCSKPQSRGSSLKSTWVIWGYLLTNFRVCVREAEIWQNSLWEENTGVHFSFIILPPRWPGTCRHHSCHSL